MRTPPHAMVALVTPFDEAGDIDIGAHRHNLETLHERGIRGFLIGGSTGEGPYLEPGERLGLVAVAREVLGDGPCILSGVNAESMRQGLAQSAEAAGAGADAVLALTPTTLVRGRADAVIDFYEGVADEAGLPVLLYTMGRVAGYELDVETSTHLAAHGNIVGLKDSNGNPTRLQEVAASAPDDFYVFCGASRAVALSIEGGAWGAITASANYAPTLLGEVVTSARKSARRAADAQERLGGLARVVESRGLAGIKLAAEISGLRPGRSRRPLPGLAAADEATLRRSLEAMRRQVLA